MSRKISSCLVILLLVVGLIVCVGLGIYAYNRSSSAGQIKELNAFAGELGLTPDSQLAQYQTCWDVFPTHCGQVAYYQTTLSRDAFQGKIDQVTSEKELPADVNVANMFDINLVTGHDLKIEKKNANSQTPLGYQWQFEERGHDWVITFYDISGDGNVYSLDGQPIDGNIVTIMLRNK
jgi:hypothetical protein